jgi:hypothetical protein
MAMKGAMAARRAGDMRLFVESNRVIFYHQNKLLDALTQVTLEQKSFAGSKIAPQFAPKHILVLNSVRYFIRSCP